MPNLIHKSNLVGVLLKKIFQAFQKDLYINLTDTCNLEKC